jgi:hypothetical protein
MRRFRLPQLIAAIALLLPSALHAQHDESPIRHTLYLALGGDPTAGDQYQHAPVATSLGVERSRVGSRWSLRLGADYRRTSSRFTDARDEHFGLGISARYGRRTGVVRPYLLAGAGVADLRRRSSGRYVSEEANAILLPPGTTVSYSTSRWNGSLTSGVGTDFGIGRLGLFTEARLNLYPARLSGGPKPQIMQTTKALYVGMKF